MNEGNVGPRVSRNHFLLGAYHESLSDQSLAIQPPSLYRKNAKKFSTEKGAKYFPIRSVPEKAFALL